MSKEELEKALAQVGIIGEWVNPDQYGFSRVFRFRVMDQIIDIEWYCNYSTLIIGNAHIWFDAIRLSSGYPVMGEWIEFSFASQNPLHLRVK